MLSRIPILISITVLVLIPGCSRNNLALRQNVEDAQQTMKDLRAAEKTYNSKKVEGRYGSLKDLADSGLMDRELIGGVRHG